MTPHPYPPHFAVPFQIDAASEARALRLLLEEADLSLGELEQLVLRLRGEPLSRAFLNAAGSGWSGVNLLPSLRAEVGMSRRQVAEAVLKYPGVCVCAGGGVGGGVFVGEGVLVQEGGASGWPACLHACCTHRHEVAAGGSVRVV